MNEAQHGTALHDCDNVPFMQPTVMARGSMFSDLPSVHPRGSFFRLGIDDKPI